MRNEFFVGAAFCFFLGCAAELPCYCPHWHPHEPPTIPHQVDLRASNVTVSGSLAVGSETSGMAISGLSGGGSGAAW